MPISPDKHAAALANLNPDAATRVAARWPLGRLEARAAAPHSSQTLCVSVFETIAARPAAQRTAILQALLAAAGLTPGPLSAPSVETEVREHRKLLGEIGGGTPTALDALMTWPSGVVTIDRQDPRQARADEAPAA